MEDAKEALRALVERIVLTPAAAGAGLDLTLEGDLAGLLRLAAGAERPNRKKAPDGTSEASDISSEIVLVAGARSQLNLRDGQSKQDKLVAGIRNQLHLLLFAPDISAWRYSSN
ncbi:hypothetical protein [Cribrihabitans pelagius]|uniref:hypothetical protein n=1 Tax=Cribrihabitans pelagius TaxID=1765746 RepID=UPI003B5AEDCE